jgi:hypothetical protein
MKRFHSRTSIFALVFMMLCSMLVTVPVSTNAEEAEEEVLKYYANLDTNMAWDGWRVHQDGQYVQYNNVNNPSGSENVNVTADKSEFFITLDKTAVWQGRLQFYNYYTDTGSPIVFGQDKIVLETKFKVKAQNYSESVPHLGIMLTWNGNKTLLMPEEIPLLADTESDYHTVKYTFDPVSRAITGELDGRVLVNSSIPNDITELSNFFFTPIAQNVPYSQSFGGYTDNQPLNNTVTWNFDSFKVYSTGKAQESGETERIELFSLDNNIRQHGTGQPILVEGSATNALWIEDYSASKAIMETPVIADDKTSFSLRQVKTSSWSVRFNLRDTYGNYFQPSTNKHLEVEVKVKVTPEGTPVNTPSAELKLDALNVVNGRTISSGALDISSESEEKWNTVRYEIIPEENTVKCYVNDELTRTGTLSITTDVYQTLGFQPVGQNAAGGYEDDTALNTPLNWVFDSFKVAEIVRHVSETEKVEVISVDTNIKQHVASPPIIVEDGSSNAVWLDDWSGTSVINAPTIASDLSSFSFEQIKTTAYGMRMNFKNLYGTSFQPPSKTHYEIEVKVKVTPTDFESDAYKNAVSSNGLPVAKLQFEGRGVLSGGGLIETNALALATPTEENWHTIRYDVNPDTNTVICYVDDEEQRQSQLSVTEDVYTAMGLRPIVQNDANSSVDAAELNIPVTWTFDSIKVYEVKEAQSPEPTPSLEPVVLPTEKPIPENLKSLVTRTYPDGKMKAAVMSYDDAAPWMWENAGSDGSKLNSEERFLDILNKYHIKATFNTVTELVKNRGLTAQWYVDKYLFDKDGNPTGHEIASHSANHVYWEEVSTMDDPRSYLMNEMTTSKEFVESVLGEGSCRGYVFPGSFPTPQDFEDLLFNAGYTYYRGGNNPSNDPFMVPDTFYNWPVTMWFGGKDDQYSTLLNYMDRFKNLDPGQEFQVFFMWGHSHDFGKGIAGYTNPDNPSDANYQTAESQAVGFERLEEWCQFLNENADTIWNPTCLEFVDYVNAVRQLDIMDDGNGNIEVHNPSDSITCYVKIENDVYSVAPGEDIFVTPSTPLPTNPALLSPVSSGAWESPLYAPDTDKDNRKDDSELLTGKTIDLGDTYRINKVEIDHDSDKIMSFTIMTSTDNENFTPVTDVYPGGVDEYTGKQTYRFPTTSARYVKYHVVLMGDYETQGKLNDMTVSYVDTESLDLSALPDEINPLEKQEIILNAIANEESGESYTLNNEGVVWSVKAISPEGVKVNGHVLKIDKNTAAGEITVTARDAGNGMITAQKTIKVVPDVFVRDFALYADDSCSQPLTNVTAGEEIFIKATLYSENTVENKNVSIFGALYSQSGELISVVPMAEAEASDEETALTASMRISDTFNPETDSIKVYIWHTDTLKPVTEEISYGVNNGINAKRVYLDKSETFLMSALSDTAVSYESSDTDVAEVDNFGTVTGTGEGIATISAKADGKVIGTAQVQVQPSLYVYLMLGQSNMSGTNDPGKEGVDVSISDGVMLLNQYGEFEPAEHRFSRYSGIWWEGSYHDGIQENGYYPSANPNGGINMGYSFAEDFVAEHSDTEIGLVVNSQAGCSIGVYEKMPQNEECNGFVNTLERVRQATAGRGELKAILWHQGESDQNQVTYPARFRNLMYDLRREIGDLELPVLAGGLLEKELNTSVHNDRTENEMNNIANYGFVSSSEPSYLQSCKEAGGFSGDSLDLVHLSARGQIEFGHRYYNMYKDIENKMKK